MCIVKTGYSFRHAIGRVDDVITRLKDIGWKHAPICDRLSTCGFVQWNKAAKQARLHCVFGVELPVGEGEDYWKFFAIDSLRPLHQLIYTATSTDDRPHLAYDEALHAEGLIKITGHRVQLQHIEPQLDLFVPLTPSLPKGVARQAIANGFDFIATSDNVYVTEDQRELYRVALGHRADVQTYKQHILSDDEWRMAIADRDLVDAPRIADALVRRDCVLEMCHAELKRGALLKPRTNRSLRDLCEEGAQRIGIDLTNSVYHERLDHELQIIEEKKFQDYFYILADMMRFARQNMQCGPGRGSSGGSLVCYLLGITAIDPIPWGLLFQRFLDITRSDLADVDLDLSDTQRHMLFDYAEKQYGEGHVARLGTVIQFRPKSLLNQIGVGLRIPKWQIDKLANAVVDRTIGDSRPALDETFDTTDFGKEFIAEHPEVRQLTYLENHPLVAGQHAAGIVITDEDVISYIAVDGRTGATMCDKEDAEALNLLKIDALGLKQLSVFERTLELIHQPIGYLERLPLDDKAAFDVLNKGHYAGVFQFNGPAQQQFAKQVKVESIDDIIALTALARPGPMGSGAARTWIKRRNGKEVVTSLHPKLMELTKETFGVLIYQEQCMQVCRELGGLSWESVSAIRKMIAKSKGNEALERYRKDFCAGAIANGIEASIAEQIWDHIVQYGAYGFNKSHAVAYGLNSYWCCYLKAHHPMEFVAATLDGEAPPDQQIAMLRELKQEDETVDYRPFDVQHSDKARWLPKEIDGKTILIGPLTSIVGIGPAAAKEIVEAREAGGLREVLQKKLDEGKTEIGSLYPIEEAIERLHPGGVKRRNGKVIEKVTPCDVVQSNDNYIVVMGVIDRLVQFDENEKDRVKRRYGKTYWGPTLALNIFLRDDRDRLLCRVDRFNFQRFGKRMMAQIEEINKASDDNKLKPSKTGKTLVALEGRVPQGYQMLMVENFKILGVLD